MTLLSVEGLGIAFGGLKAVDNVSFSVNPGEIVSVIGPNGAGKTTLFNMISGVYMPKSGKVRLNGEDVTGFSPHLLARRGMSRTFQNLQIFQNMSVLENAIAGFHLREKGSVFGDLLGLPGSRRRSREAREGARALLARVGLANAAELEAGSLSYGALKRLEIARALALNPKVLLLDEPAAGMNPQETNELKELVCSIRDNQQLSILLIEHDMGMVMSLSDRIYVMEYGSCIATGIPAEIRTNPRVIKAYLGESDA